MRNKTLASMLLLCGATAAFAQVVRIPPDRTTVNKLVVNNAAVANSGDDQAPKD
jgi:uncharacterized protein YccT (UPF0319 family)